MRPMTCVLLLAIVVAGVACCALDAQAWPWSHRAAPTPSVPACNGGACCTGGACAVPTMPAPPAACAPACALPAACAACSTAPTCCTAPACRAAATEVASADVAKRKHPVRKLVGRLFKGRRGR